MIDSIKNTIWFEQRERKFNPSFCKAHVVTKLVSKIQGYNGLRQKKGEIGVPNIRLEKIKHKQELKN